MVLFPPILSWMTFNSISFLILEDPDAAIAYMQLAAFITRYSTESLDHDLHGS